MSRSHSRHHQREKQRRAKAHRNQGIPRRHQYTPEWEREPGVRYPKPERHWDHYPSHHPPPAFPGRHSGGRHPWDTILPIKRAELDRLTSDIEIDLW